MPEKVYYKTKRHLLDIRRYHFYQRNVTRCGKTWDREQIGTFIRDKSCIDLKPNEDRLGDYCKYCQNNWKENKEDEEQEDFSSSEKRFLNE